MGQYIVKLEDYYFEWSTIVDAPVTFGMTLKDFKKYYRKRYGTEGMEKLPERLERVAKHGSSAIPNCDWLPHLFEHNNAGPNSDELTQEEIYQAYCLRQPIRDGWLAK